MLALLKDLKSLSSVSMNSAVVLASPGRWFRGHSVFMPAGTKWLRVCAAKFTLIAVKGERVICLSVNFGAFTLSGF